MTMLPCSQLQAKGSFSLRDALRGATGLLMAAGEGGRTGDSLTIRGFAANSDTYIDGLKDNGQYFRDTFDLYRVEVLRGAAAMLFGRGATGGAVNSITRKPADSWSGDTALTVHRVEPVTQGCRIAAFFWVQSLVRDDGRRALLFNLDLDLGGLRRRGLGAEPELVALTGVYHNLLRQWAET